MKKIKKKIYLSESSISSVLNNRLLPKFIFNAVKKHETSLGDNEAFPNGGDYPFDYTLLKTRYKEVCEAINEFGLDGLNEDYLMSELSSSIRLCKEMEAPIRDNLEKICENAVNRLFAIPEDIINLRLKIVDRINFKNAVRLRPESSNDLEYTFDDVTDLELANKSVAKRRFIDSLIQGASYLYSNVLGLYIEDIEKINKDLIPLYRKITAINDYLLFTKKETMSDKNPMQGSYAEVHLSVGGGDGKSTIRVQGIIFPLLLQETIKGLFELFSAHGLPSDMEKAMYIIKKADFVLAEPWDMRFGVILWQKIFGRVEDTNMIPYMFTSLVSMDTETFNASVKEILANTKKGQSIVDELIKQAEYDNGYQQFTNRINAKNVDKSLIQDSYFTGADANGYEIDSDSDDSIIEESEDADVMGQYEMQVTKPIEYYQQLVKSATVDNIDFLEGNINGVTEDLIVTINGEIIPRAMILLMVQSVKIRITESERVPMLQVHIILNDGIQRLGLAPKIYKKLIYTFGAIYSGEGRRINKEHIAKVYAKLAQDPDLYVYHDDMCYIAMRRNSSFVSESVTTNKSLLTEGWGKDKRRIVARTINILRQNIPWADNRKLADLEKDILVSYFHGSKESSPKFRPYEQVIAKILSGELGYPNNPTNAKEVNALKDVFKYIWFEINNGIEPNISYGVNKLTNEFGCDDFKTIMSKYYDKAEEYKKNVEKNEKTHSAYDILRIDSFEEASKFTPYLTKEVPLCFTTHENQWDNFTKGGSNTAYVCLENGWEDIHEKKGKNFPYDEYGLSMIWVFIDPNGNLSNCCIRWNHHGEGEQKKYGYGGVGADDALSKDAIENVVGVTFEDAFPNDFNEKVKEITERLNNGELGIDIFEEKDIRQITQDLFLIYIGSKCNFFDMRTNEIVHKDYWFDDFDDFEEKLKDFGAIGMVYNTNSMGDIFANMIDRNGEFILPDNMWFNEIRLISDGYLQLTFGNKSNIYDTNFQAMLPKWAIKIENRSGIYYILLEDGSLYISDSGKLSHLESAVDILNNKPNLVDYLNGYNDSYRTPYNGIGKLGIYEYIVKEDGSLLVPYFFNDVYRRDDYYFCKSSYNHSTHENILTKDGNFIIKSSIEEWPKNISSVYGGNYLICRFLTDDYKEYYNIVDRNGNYLIDGNRGDWPDSISVPNEPEEFETTIFFFEKNKKRNIFIPNKGLLWKRPLNQWFDECSEYSHLKYYLGVSINDNGDYKENYINYMTGELLVNEEPENWYEYVSLYRDYNGNPLSIVKKDEVYNVIFSNGMKLFDDDDGCINITVIGDYENVDTLFTIKKSGGPYNIFDMRKNAYISDQWFENVTNLGDKIIDLVLNGVEYTYDIYKHEFLSVNAAMHNRLESLTPETIKDYKDITTFIPEKMYRIKIERSYGYMTNVIINNNGRYEYLFDKWYRAIYKPVGNAMALKGNNEFDCYIYDISTNEFILSDIAIEDVDRDNGMIVIKNTDNYENIVTSNCEMVFDEWQDKLEIWNEKYVKVFKLNEHFMLYDVINHIYVLNGQEFNYINGLSGTSDYYMVSRDTTTNDGKLTNEYNILNNNGSLSFEKWFGLIVQYPTSEVSPLGNGLCLLLDNIHNYVTIGDIRTGEIISDTSLKYVNNVSRIEKNGKVNFISGNRDANPIQPLLDEWADNATNIDSRGYTKVTYGNNTFTYQAINGQLNPIDQEGEATIPYDFTECNGNQINLIDHRLIYKLIGYREGATEHTTTYSQKVTVITSDGRKLEQIYTQRGDESCKWTMYEVYERLCNQLGIKPASME